MSDNSNSNRIPTFESLPLDVIDKIFDFFDQPTLITAALACKIFSRFTQKRLYRKLYLQDYKLFPGLHDNRKYSSTNCFQYTYLKNDFNVLTNVDLNLNEVNKSMDILRITVYSYKRFLNYIDNLIKLQKVLEKNTHVQVQKLVIDFQLIDNRINWNVFQIIIRIILHCNKLESIEFTNSLVREYFKINVNNLLQEKKLVIDVSTDINVQTASRQARTNIGGVDPKKIPNKNIQLILKKQMVRDNELMKLSFRNYNLLFNDVLLNFRNHYYLFRALPGFSVESEYFQTFVKDCLINNEYLKDLVKRKWLIDSRSDSLNIDETILNQYQVKTVNLEIENSHNFVNHLKEVYKLVQQTESNPSGLDAPRKHLYCQVETLNLSFQIHPFKTIIDIVPELINEIQHVDGERRFNENYLVRLANSIDLSKNFLNRFVNFSSLKKLTVSHWFRHNISFPLIILILETNFAESQFQNLRELNLVGIPTHNSYSSLYITNLKLVLGFAAKFSQLEYLQINFQKEQETNSFLQMNFDLFRFYKCFDHILRPGVLSKLKVFNFDSFNHWFLCKMLHVALEEGQSFETFAASCNRIQVLHTCSCSNCQKLYALKQKLKLGNFPANVLDICEFLIKMSNRSFRSNNEFNINNDKSKFPTPSVLMNRWLLHKDTFNSISKFDSFDPSTSLQDPITPPSSSSSQTPPLKRSQALPPSYGFVNFILKFLVHAFRNLVKLSLEKFPDSKMLLFADLPIKIESINTAPHNIDDASEIITIGAGSEAKTYKFSPLIHLDEEYCYNDDLGEYDVVKEIGKVNRYLTSIDEQHSL